MIVISTRAIRQYCRDIGMTEAFMEQHYEILEKLVLRAASGQKIKDAQAIRAWWFDKNPAKDPLFKVLDDDN
jgi:hypothetical protein